MSTIAPRLRHRITFQKQVQARNSDGVLTVEWENVWLNSERELVNVPAEVLTGPGREAVRSGQMQSDTAARINCRWFPGLSSAWRILWDDRIFNIGSFDTDKTARREWRITCTEGLNDGQ